MISKTDSNRIEKAVISLLKFAQERDEQFTFDAKRMRIVAGDENWNESADVNLPEVLINCVLKNLLAKKRRNHYTLTPTAIKMLEQH